MIIITPEIRLPPPALGSSPRVVKGTTIVGAGGARARGPGLSFFCRERRSHLTSDLSFSTLLISPSRRDLGLHLGLGDLHGLQIGVLREADVLAVVPADPAPLHAASLPGFRAVTILSLSSTRPKPVASDL